MLGIEDHGIMTCSLHLDYGGSGQAFGGRVFDSLDRAKNRRVGHPYGIEFIRAVLETVGVERWEDLKNRHVRAECDGPFGQVTGIGHIIKDVWFRPEELARVQP